MSVGPLLALGVLALRCLHFLPAYIANNTFPQPLTEAEEAGYLKQLAAGCEAARTALIERNLRLVAHIVKKFDNTGEDVDDLISIGTVGLIKAIGTFDPRKKTRLATYAARCIENEVLMYLRSLRKTRGEVSLYDPIGVDREGNEIALIDVLGSDPDAVSEQVGNRLEETRLLETLKCLRPNERRVLEMRFGLRGGSRLTQREIARILGISRSYVSRIEKRAIRNVARLLDAPVAAAPATVAPVAAAPAAAPPVRSPALCPSPARGPGGTYR